uniref:Uncharacterized protein n=1 Tax=Anguilla anguilla TaxID=7936 RepID=A0A0E9PB05_ANGAN
MCQDAPLLLTATVNTQCFTVLIVYKYLAPLWGSSLWSVLSSEMLLDVMFCCTNRVHITVLFENQIWAGHPDKFILREMLE